MKRIISLFFKTIGIIVYIGSGIVGFIMILIILNKVIGFWGIVLGLTIFPVVLVAAPWYVFIEWFDPIPLIIIYGGGIIASILYWIGYLLDES